MLSIIKEGHPTLSKASLMFEQFPYCVVCNQLIHSGDVSVMRDGGRAHTRCIDPRYYPQHLPEKIKIIKE